MNAHETVHIAADLFQTCRARGWLTELLPSAITLQALETFEAEGSLQLPPFYKDYLTAYQLPRPVFDICGIAWHAYELSPLWLSLYGVTSTAELSAQRRAFCEEAVELRQAEPAACAHLLPIGDWGAGWGPLCLDLTKAETLADPDDPATWSVVWFDHEEFDWPAEYAGTDGQLHGAPAAPDLRTLLEWYFCGALEAEFEAENHVKVTYDRLNDQDFCQSYWEERWQEQ